MNNTENVFSGCQLFMTKAGKYKIRCRCCEKASYFDSLNDYIDHWIGKRRAAFTWFPRHSVTSKGHIKARFVIKPSTREYEVYCNMCTQHNVFHNIEHFISHVIECHKNIKLKDDFKDILPNANNDSLKDNSSIGNQTDEVLLNNVSEEMMFQESYQKQSEKLPFGLSLYCTMTSDSIPDRIRPDQETAQCSKIIYRPVENEFELTPIGDCYMNDNSDVDRENVDQSADLNTKRVDNIKNLMHFSEASKISEAISTFRPQEIGYICEAGSLVSMSVKNLTFENQNTGDDNTNEIHRQQLPSSTNSYSECTTSSANSQPNSVRLKRKKETKNANLPKKFSKKPTTIPKCNVCNKSFARSHGYDLHMRAFHPYKECNICKIRFKNTEELLQHLELHRRETECPICHDTINWYTHKHLSRHFKLLSSDCCTIFTSDENVLLEYLLPSTWNLLCKTCNVLFENPTALRRHAFSKHGNSEPFECAHCGQKFQYFQAMESHQKNCAKVKTNEV